MNRPFPKEIIQHESLTPFERISLWAIDPEELSRSAYLGLLALVEGVITERTPGFHCTYQIIRSTSSAEGFALCSHLLHESNGFTSQPDIRYEMGQVEKGRAWLKYPHPPLTALLAFYFKLREFIRQH